ncbi:MAG: DUF349 domain-containing protein [Eggerthellaceae bacterium]|nr:DUF349 domain-containing protein [Eggerthellaceae bacterium]
MRFLAGSDDWKAAGDRLKELFEEWKSAGFAGNGDDDVLWAEFNGIRQEFFERRRLYYDERDREFAARAERKGAIVQEASAIAARCDYAAPSAERMKELDREWKDVGFCGRDDEDRLWALFQDAKDSFWSGKRAYAEQRQREWREKTVEAIGRKRDQVANLQEQITDLQDKMVGMRNQEYVDNMCRWIGEKEARIRELEAAIRDMESRL